MNANQVSCTDGRGCDGNREKSVRKFGTTPYLITGHGSVFLPSRPLIAPRP